MLEISTYKKEYDVLLDGFGVAYDDILLYCESDMCRDMSFGDTLIFVTEKELIVAEGQVVLEGGHKIASKSTLVKGYKKREVKSYLLSEIEGFKLEEMISSVRLIANYKGESVVIAMGTFSAKNSLRLLVKYTKRVKKNKEFEVDENDFDKALFCPKCGTRYPDPASKVCPKCVDKVALFKRFGHFIKKYRTRIVIIIAAYIVVSLMGIFAAYFSSAFFYDRVILNPNDRFYGKVLLVVLIVAAVNIASILANMFGNFINANMAGRFIKDLKITIFESMKKLSMDFFTGRQTGGLMTQVNNDANSIYWFFVDGIPYYTVNIIQVVAAAVMMFALNPLLAILCVAILPIFLFTVKKLVQRSKYHNARFHAARRKMNSRLSDSLAGLRVIKAFAKEKDESERFARAAKNSADSYKNVAVFSYTAVPAARSLMYVTNIIVWSVGGWLTITGKMSYGFYVAFAAYAGLLNSPMYMIADMLDACSSCINAMQRLFEIYEAEPTVKEAAEPRNIDGVAGDVEFKNVTFSYEKSRKIIDNVSFKIEPGRQIGIVGHSGAGKSTLANLLIRLYDVDEGEILIDGINVKEWPFRTLRDNVCIVSQETYLFEGTIFDNISYAKPEADRLEIIAAAKLAGAHEFIVKLPEGYQTMIGTGYKELSGGERQRVSIARAILKNPKILILDEATAAMDTKTEQAIQSAIDRLSEGRTTIMIAHRLSTLRNADSLLVIENGKIEESGTHTELMSRDGPYRRLYNLQLEAMKNVLEEVE